MIYLFIYLLVYWNQTCKTYMHSILYKRNYHELKWLYPKLKLVGVEIGFNAVQIQSRKESI